MSDDLVGLARRYRDALDAEPGTRALLRRARARFADRLHGAGAPSPSGARWLVPLALGLAAAGLVAVVAWPERPLGVTLRGHPEAPFELVQTAATEDVLDFSDGSEVRVRPASAVRLLGVTAAGSSVALERGAAQVSVVHRPHARWLFLAGPYRVAVVGTRFELRWDPTQGGLEVAMDDGVVEVEGPGLAKQRVTSRQRLTAVAQPPSAALYLAGAEAAAAGGEVEAAPRPRVERAPAERPRATGPSWRQLADQGDALGAMTAAEQAGFGLLANSMPRGDVLALGAVALEARQPGRAAEAWLAVRQRFPGSAGATEAALRLGQLASGPEGDAATAAQWYRRAAREAPSGPLAAQALGGWLQAAARAGRVEEARRLAAEYLRRFRNGPDAAAAKALLQPAGGN